MLPARPTGGGVNLPRTDSAPAPLRNTMSMSEVARRAADRSSAALPLELPMPVGAEYLTSAAPSPVLHVGGGVLLLLLLLLFLREPC
jgi:hypothetical protein